MVLFVALANKLCLVILSEDNVGIKCLVVPLAAISDQLGLVVLLENVGN